MDPHWTKAMVERRLLEAERVFQRTVKTFATRRRAADVPPHIHTDEDRMEWMRAQHERLKLEGFYDPNTGLLQKPVPLDWGHKPHPEREALERAQEAMRWMGLYVVDERERVCLACFLVFKTAKRHGFSAAVNDRLARSHTAPVQRAWAYVLKDRALTAIGVALTAQKAPWVDFEEAA